MRKSEIEEISHQLNSFIPADASVRVAEYIVDQNVKLTITRKRKTKLGDYRAPGNKVAYHRVSINGDLNQYMFLLVLLHEFAHLEVWNEHRHRIKAHGAEWKSKYKKLYDAFSIYFPDNVKLIIQNHFENLKATTCNDPYLTKHLMHMDRDEEIQLLNDLDPGDRFESNGRMFQMLNKRRTRFLCEDLLNKRKYLVSGSAVVVRLNK